MKDILVVAKLKVGKFDKFMGFMQSEEGMSERRKIADLTKTLGTVSPDKSAVMFKIAVHNQGGLHSFLDRIKYNQGIPFTIKTFEVDEIFDSKLVFEIHSIEQPIKPGQWEDMAFLCKNTPLPIALDEELIGIFDSDQKKRLLDSINPQFIVLKPSFIGGFKGSQEWINLAKKQNIGWWITSALESNVGLNAISQWTYSLNTNGPQGLGTGSLFTNNVDSPLEVKNGFIGYNNTKIWSRIK